MFKIVFELKAIDSLKSYISGYKNYFKKLFLDTGLVAEDEIINSYIVVADKFYNLIIDKIFEVLSSDIVGYILRDDRRFITLSIKNYRFFIYFRENENKKIRYIEDIEIFKK